MRFSSTLALLALRGTTLLPSQVWAYRPFDLTDADVVEHREAEIELGPVAIQRSSEELVLVAPSLVINVGVLPRIELVAEGKNERLLRPSSDGRWRPGELALSLKALVRRGSLQGEEGLSIALEPSVLFPGRDQGGVGGEVGVIASIVGPNGALHLDVVPGLSRAHAATAVIGLIAEGPREWTIRPAGEWVASGEVGAGAIVSMLYGLIARVDETLSFDGAVRAERGNGTTTLEARVGLTWAFRS